MATAQDLVRQESSASLLAQSLGVDDDDLRLLEEAFTKAAAGKGISGGKVFSQLRRGADFGRALGVSTKTIDVLYARAHRWCAIGRHEKAESIFRALCVLDTASADFRTGLGICLRARSAWDDALAAFQSASRLRPDWAIPHFHALELCVRREAWDQAAAELAAFESKADDWISADIVTEAARYKAVLLQRNEKNKSEISRP
jgi:tetratricopeptide (TPR) repeat protein